MTLYDDEEEESSECNDNRVECEFSRNIMKTAVKTRLDGVHTTAKTPVKTRMGSNKKGRGSCTSKAIISHSDDTIDEESNTLKLGGIWKDLYIRLHSLEETCKQQGEIIGFISEDRDSLLHERCETLYKFKHNAQELSSTALSHLEAKEIIKIIKNEKEVVDYKLTALESQREWLEKEIKNHKSTIAMKDSSIVANNVCIGELSQNVADQVEENKVLQDIVYNKDEIIESVKNKLMNKEEEIEVLRRSIAAKEKQFAALLKDRDRIKNDFDNLKKQPIYIRLQNNKNIITPSKCEHRKLYSPAAVTDLEIATPECVKEDIDINNLLSCSSLLQSSSPSFNIKERQYLSIIKRLQDRMRDKSCATEETIRSTPFINVSKRVASPNESSNLNQVSKVLFKETESGKRSPVCASPVGGKSTIRMSKSLKKTDNCVENNVIRIEVTERSPAIDDLQQPCMSPCPSPSAGKSPTRLALRRLRGNL